MELKEFGPPGEGGAHPKFYYVDPPLITKYNFFGVINCLESAFHFKGTRLAKMPLKTRLDNGYTVYVLDIYICLRLHVERSSKREQKLFRLLATHFETVNFGVKV